MSEESMEALTTQGDGDSPEYIQQMVDRAEGKPTEATTESPPGSESETLLAGKFKSQEELEKAYLELQSKLGSRTPDNNNNNANTDNGEGEGSESSSESADLPDRAETTEEPSGEEPAGIDFERYNKSISENGELSEDDYQELASKGYPKEMVDLYILGMQTAVASRRTAAVEAVGGQENFDAVRKWASESLSDTEYAAFQKQIMAAQSPEDVAVVYGVLNQKYAAANPTEASLQLGKGGPSPTLGGYASRKQMSDAINDPRYESDPGYRREVESRIAASNF